MTKTDTPAPVDGGMELETVREKLRSLSFLLPIEAEALALIDRLTAALTTSEAARVKAVEALRPFANSVFNDNGDVTFDHTMYVTDDLFRAYRLVKKADALTQGATP
jgi:hypothetical protein